MHPELKWGKWIVIFENARGKLWHEITGYARVPWLVETKSPEFYMAIQTSYPNDALYWLKPSTDIEKFGG